MSMGRLPQKSGVVVFGDFAEQGSQDVYVESHRYGSCLQHLVCLCIWRQAIEPFEFGDLSCVSETECGQFPDRRANKAPGLRLSH